ncbi:MAG: hypothetical protein Q9Q13_06735 [Acidobacteriota bacterium]|nr:hypothetical protein [Acidobacteriota bacterium]
MRKDLSDRHLDRLLGALRRPPASPGFTRGVVRSLDESRPSRRPAAVAAVVLAAMVLTAAVLLGLKPPSSPSAGSPALVAREEISRLQQELDQLRRQAAPPLVLLDAGGDRPLAVELGRRAEREPSRIYAVYAAADGRITY